MLMTCVSVIFICASKHQGWHLKQYKVNLYSRFMNSNSISYLYVITLEELFKETNCLYKKTDDPDVLKKEILYKESIKRHI